MPKKIDEAEVKKECPSCGLGVSLESTVCEFCGWDFKEEDEWILQIEKLERDLMLEKQKFEPGSVEDKIESTLHSPNIVAKEAAAPSPKPTATPLAKETPVVPKQGRGAETKKPSPAPEPVVQKPAPVKAEPPKPVVEKTPTHAVEKPAPPRPAPPVPVVARTPEPPVQKPASSERAPPSTVPVAAPQTAPKAVPSQNIRRVRVVRAAPAQEPDESHVQRKKLVRKVKEKS